MQKKIAILATGGTLAGTAASPGDNIGYAAAQLGIAQILAGIPALAGLPLEAEQLAQIDSKDMDVQTWRTLALRCAQQLSRPDVGGVVVTHGTDTLEETAYFLHAVLAPTKPLVLTCAMRPATALMPDGPQNIVDAVAVAMSEGAQGVVVVCAGTIHGAHDVAKQHTYRLNAFSSGDAGPVGYVEEGRLRLLRAWPPSESGAAALFAKVTHAVDWPWVEIVMSHAGATGAGVDAWVAQGVRGIVVAGTGNGTVHRDLEAALLRAQARGVRVLRATRCAQGRVLAVAGDALPDSGGLSAVKARIALMLALLG